MSKKKKEEEAKQAAMQQQIARIRMPRGREVLGILEERLLNSEIALKYLNKYLEINPNAEDIDFILEMIRSIKTKN